MADAVWDVANGTFLSLPVLVLCTVSIKFSQTAKSVDTDRLSGDTNSWCHRFRSVPRQIQDNPVLCLHLSGWHLHTVLHLPTLGNRAWRSFGWLNCSYGKSPRTVALRNER